MATHKKFNYILIILSLGFLILSISVGKISKKPAFYVNKQDSAINLNYKLLSIFSLGQKRLITNLMWISTLLESDTEHYQEKDLNNWMYLRFKAITSLDPNFIRAYQFGGKYLLIIKDDLDGASVLLNDGLARFPDDYQLHFDLAFLYAFEIYDYVKAHKHYVKIMNYPQAPKYLPSLLTKLNFEVTNDLPTTFNVISEMYKNEPDGSLLKEKFQQDLYSIKAEIDIECLNLKNIGCEKLDFMGNPYIKINNQFTTQKKFVPYRLKK